MEPEKKIIHSWHANAANWIHLVESNGLESRKLVTNQAIVDAVIAYHPPTVLDLGCGEGWLSKELGELGMEVTGIDAIPELVERARSKTPGDFIVASYEDLAASKVLTGKQFDVIVINFALIGKDSTEAVLLSLANHLLPGGHLLIQTLHPEVRKTAGDYVTGWKKGSWDGLGDRFSHAYEWYFRTLEDWLDLLKSSGFERVVSKETKHPITGHLLSIIFECSVK